MPLKIGSLPKDDISDFAPGERDSIKRALTQLNILINERFAQNDAQIVLVNNYLNYLTEKVEELNKTDWKGIMISTIFSIMITLSLDVERGSELMQLLVQIFQFAPGLLH